MSHFVTDFTAIYLQRQLGLYIQNVFPSALQDIDLWSVIYFLEKMYFALLATILYRAFKLPSL